MRVWLALALTLTAGCGAVVNTATKPESAKCKGWKEDCKAANRLLESDGYPEKTSAACRWYEAECR